MAFKTYKYSANLIVCLPLPQGTKTMMEEAQVQVQASATMHHGKMKV